MGLHQKIPIAVTLGWLEEKYLESPSDDTARISPQDLFKGALELHTPKEALADYSVIPRDEGAKRIRLNMQASDGVEYWTYSPPALWGTPVTLLRVTLEPRAKQDDFVFHNGEEVTVPISGTLRYRFLWGEPGQGVVEREEELSPGQIGAVQPANPHHGWAVGNSPSETWVMLYHDPDSSSAFDIAANLQGTKPLDELPADEKAKEKLSAGRRRLKVGDLKIGTGQYALIAWQISDRIKTQRQRVNLSIHQMASLIGLDASHLSRIENEATNVSVEVLLKICNFLRIDLRSLLNTPRWYFERQELVDVQTDKCIWGGAGHKHMVHPRYISLSGASCVGLQSCLPNEPMLSSWVVLSGNVRIELLSHSKTNAVSLGEGDVIHFRRNFTLHVEALTDCQMVAFRLSTLCPSKFQHLDFDSPIQKSSS